MNATGSRLIIRKREGAWKIAGIVWFAGQWFPYAWACVDTYDDVPQAAAEVWDLMPDRSGTEPNL